MIKFSRGAPHEVKRRLWEIQIFRSLLKSKTRSEARLHKISVWTKGYGYDGLTRLGDFKDATNIGWQNPDYDRKYIRHFKDFYIIAFVNPKERFLPRLIINIYPQKDISPEEYKRFLKQIDSSLPGLKVSSVEYAVDLFCKSPDIVRAVFEVVIKYLYIPNQRKINMINNMKNQHSNRLYRIGESYKVYERGKDADKQKEGYWHLNDLDRVRLEFTTNRESLRKNGIDTLKNLIDDPKFVRSNWQKYLFRHFKYTKRSRKSLGPYGERLPAPYERYKVKDKSGVSGTFYSEYFMLKNRLQYFQPYLTKP